MSGAEFACSCSSQLCALLLQVHLLEQLLEGRRDLLARAPAIQEELAAMQQQAEAAEGQLAELTEKAGQLKHMQVRMELGLQSYC